ncbi:hypothetical protein EKL29_07990 [Pantoea sp. YU22]|uniref:hypothetical protein n=1 Tax=Pantoea TaxID=53335 RepID=UPI000F86AD6B|nr:MULTISPECIES: hypothetical protein [Pantoea]RTY58763.1 hypothetical protein EKL29_07990 [Pantoea sp. YU22]
MMQGYTEEQRKALVDWLKPQISELEAVCDEIPFGLDEDDSMQLQVMKIALASLTAEPEYTRYDCGCCGFEVIDEWRDNDVCPKCNHKPLGKTELYTAPPAPALRLPDAVSCDGFNEKEPDEARNLGQCEGWNAYRAEAVRLNATAPQPVKVNLTGILASFPAVGEGIYLEKAGVERAIRQAGGQVEE